MRSVVYAGFFVVTAAATATAQPSAFLTAPEARRIFYGIDMQGEHQPSGQRWRECIDPDGKTAYWLDGAFDEGRLTVRADGALCFSYASSGFRDVACWRAKRVGRSNYRFESESGGEGVFATDRTRAAQSCPGRETPTS